jgi:hypothetical protein
VLLKPGKRRAFPPLVASSSSLSHATYLFTILILFSSLLALARSAFTRQFLTPSHSQHSLVQRSPASSWPLPILGARQFPVLVCLGRSLILSTRPSLPLARSQRCPILDTRSFPAPIRIRRNSYQYLGSLLSVTHRYSTAVTSSPFRPQTALHTTQSIPLHINNHYSIDRYSQNGYV